MAGIAIPNLKTYYLGTIRDGEVTGADWAGGVNLGGSNAPGIGVNTGDINPKESDWPYVEVDPGNSQALGEDAGPILVEQGADLNDQVAFVQATGAVAPDADIIVGVANKTGKTMALGDWAWGLKAQA